MPRPPDIYIREVRRFRAECSLCDWKSRLVRFRDQAETTLDRHLMSDKHREARVSGRV